MRVYFLPKGKWETENGNERREETRNLKEYTSDFLSISGGTSFLE